MASAGAVFRREDLAQRAWTPETESSVPGSSPLTEGPSQEESRVDHAIKTLRRDPDFARHIVTVRGIGYMWAKPDQRS